jgi:hypothetical protein
MDAGNFTLQIAKLNFVAKSPIYINRYSCGLPLSIQKMVFSSPQVLDRCSSKLPSSCREGYLHKWGRYPVRVDKLKEDVCTAGRF